MRPAKNNNETGMQESGPITQLEKDDGRPVGKDCRYVEVDCISNPLVCQLLGPVLDEEEEDYTGEAFPPGVKELPGHNKFSYQTPYNINIDFICIFYFYVSACAIKTFCMVFFCLALIAVVCCSNNFLLLS